MLNKIISNRAGMYGFLARLYRDEVDRQLLDRIAGMDFLIKFDLPEITEGFRKLKDCLDHRNENTIFDLATDYAGIFIVAGGKGDCAYPYESVYSSPQKLVMQDARDQVLKLYRENGLDKSPESIESEDHIAVELEFMSYLCHRISGALTADDKDLALSILKKQRSFLEEHLLNWVPAFCRDIERIAAGDFYKAMAKITAGYLHLEQEVIGELMNTIKTS
jgi:TorA maturation chaperone TorD